MSEEKPPAKPRHAGMFKPGQSGNPGGQPVGIKNAISLSFMRSLAKDFNIHGEDAIKEFREKDPGGYIQMIARLLPQEANINIRDFRTPKELSDEQIMEILNEPIEAESTIVIDVPPMAAPPGLN